ncbi:MAG: DUF4240 domain-containing protein [Myxococcota bacterium]
MEFPPWGGLGWGEHNSASPDEVRGEGEFRGWLIAQGRRVYEAALADPDSLAAAPGLEDGGDVELEGLWYVARQVYEDLTGSEMGDVSARIDASDPTFDGDFDDDAFMAATYPRLHARFSG